MKMKRLMTSLLAGAFGVMLLTPATYAWENPRVERRAEIWQDRQAAKRHRAELAAHEGYYNGGYYYPNSYSWAPVPGPVYAYGYKHPYRHWHHVHND